MIDLENVLIPSILPAIIKYSPKYIPYIQQFANKIGYHNVEDKLYLKAPVSKNCLFTNYMLGKYKDMDTDLCFGYNNRGQECKSSLRSDIEHFALGAICHNEPSDEKAPGIEINIDSFTSMNASYASRIIANNKRFTASVYSAFLYNRNVTLFFLGKDGRIQSLDGKDFINAGYIITGKSFIVREEVDVYIKTENIVLDLKTSDLLIEKGTTESLVMFDSLLDNKIKRIKKQTLHIDNNRLLRIKSDSKILPYIIDLIRENCANYNKYIGEKKSIKRDLKCV